MANCLALDNVPATLNGDEALGEGVQLVDHVDARAWLGTPLVVTDGGSGQPLQSERGLSWRPGSSAP